ncbi:hypothetical protein RF55_3740 [Lasius niger]|uniref:Uncharacterized protein n=1 Tax=Lasius niger TaxID=67767 RepID=A0A0J7L087_LASNI|nr:hypothetical protein RF55_3740 [Lasius niger]
MHKKGYGTNICNPCERPVKTEKPACGIGGTFAKKFSRIGHKTPRAWAIHNQLANSTQNHKSTKTAKGINHNQRRPNLI